MLSLSPAKLLVILVIALIVLGPEKLPQMARQIGAAWHDVRRWRGRLETEVRGTFPNLPPTHEVAQAVRSPLAFLERLADEHEQSLGDDTTGPEAQGTAGTQTNGTSPPAGAEPTPPGGLDTAVSPGNGSVAGNGAGARHGAGTPSGPTVPGAVPALPDDPSMN